MSIPPRTEEANAIATVDLSPFFDKSEQCDPATGQLLAGRSLVEALRSLGFVQIVGHGMNQGEMDEALGWAKRLFDLPYDDKVKAPHPPGPMPHRGYSGLGQEKVYSQSELEADNKGSDIGQDLRKISDFKESYDIGSELDPCQKNIWLPHDVLPDFRPYMTALYEKLCGVAKTTLYAIGIGLGLQGSELASLMALVSDRHSQIRLLHYPPVSKETLQDTVLARLPPHHDWSTFTMLFQDRGGGLELKDPATGTFMKATPQDGALVLNIGDMLQRFSNDYFISAVHRVSLPGPDDVSPAGIPARYSVPFFVCPDFSHVVSTSAKFVTEANPAKYTPVTPGEYGSMVSKYQYQEDE